MTVFDNVAFGPQAKQGAQERDHEAASPSCSRSCASPTSPTASPASSPAASSSASRSRARSSTIPSALLLDEPLGALDLKLRQAMQLELKRIQREVGITFVYVTHDQEEALTMSRPHRGHERGPGRADRHARGDLPQPGVGVRRRLHRRRRTCCPATVDAVATATTPIVTLPGGTHTVGPARHGRSAGTAPATVMVRPERLACGRRAGPTARRACGRRSCDLTFQGPLVRIALRARRRHRGRRAHRTRGRPPAPPARRRRAGSRGSRAARCSRLAPPTRRHRQRSTPSRHTRLEGAEPSRLIAERSDDIDRRRHDHRRPSVSDRRWPHPPPVPRSRRRPVPPAARAGVLAAAAAATAQRLAGSAAAQAAAAVRSAASSSVFELARSTSTRSRRRTSTVSEAPASTLKYSEALNDNNEFFAKYPATVQPGRAPSASTSSPRRAGWRAADRPRLRSEAAARPDPERGQPARRAQNARVGPHRRVHAAVADRLHRHRVQHRGHRPRADERRRPLRPEVHRQGRHAHRDARHDRPAGHEPRASTSRR